MRSLSLLLLCLCLTLTACHPAPPTLGPVAVTAFQNHQVQNALDTIRDIAVDANAVSPPILTTATTRKVVTWHRSAITILHARSAGWQTVLTTGLDEVLKDLPAKERETLAPYVILAKTILAGVL